jgi:hypothetical protein
MSKRKPSLVLIVDDDTYQGVCAEEKQKEEDHLLLPEDDEDIEETGLQFSLPRRSKGRQSHQDILRYEGDVNRFCRLIQQIASHSILKSAAAVGVISLSRTGSEKENLTQRNG